MRDETDPKITRRDLIQVGTATLVALNTASSLPGLAPGATQAAAQPAPATARVSVARYVLARLAQHNCNVLFGIPGKTCEDLIVAAARPVPETDLALVVTTTDAEAAFAADAYARLRGLGAVAVTYGVGTLGLTAAIAGAYVERSPVVVINGGPSLTADIKKQADDGTLFTHGIGRNDTDLTVLRQVTAFAARIETVATARATIDQALTMAMREQRPVYIEIARDVWKQTLPAPGAPLDATPAGAAGDTATAQRILRTLSAARRPALLLGIEIARYGLVDDVTTLVERLGIPYATTLLAKSVIADTTPGFVGVYGGTSAPPSVRTVIEGADALVAVGCVFGRGFRSLVEMRGNELIRLANGTALFGRATRTNPPIPAGLAGVLGEMRRQPFTPRSALVARTRLPGLSFDERRHSITEPPRTGIEPGLTYDDMARTVSGALTADLFAITDTSLSMYPLADINVSGPGGFLCNGIYQSIGYSLPAALGVGLAQARRPLVICGDGGFQMTAPALSTLVRNDIRAIVIVLDNALYGIEQLLIEPDYFDDPNASSAAFLKLAGWNYAQLAAAVGVRHSATVATPAELAQALQAALAADGPMLITARIKPHNRPRHIVPS
jgi:indolepyruvate decarboxylase